jgi:outer membrane protein TolC
LCAVLAIHGQEPGPIRTETLYAPAAASSAPLPAGTDKPLPINLATALKLAGARPLDIELAIQRTRISQAELDQARVLWLPTILVGGDYFRHDGQIQDVQGHILGTSKSTLMAGAAPIAVFAVTDAIFAPLAVRQVVRARDADVQAARNDSLLFVAEAYFNVQQARGELAGAQAVVKQLEELVRRTEKLAPGIIPQVEATRARAELSRRKQTVTTARLSWRTSSAELGRILRLEPAALVEPQEPPQVRVTIVGLTQPVDDLIPLALTNRPELASQQALVQATLQRIKQEKLRPLVPSVLLRGASTNPAGTLAGGVFGGGIDDHMSKFSARGDFDLQVLWELQNLGFGNHARVEGRKAEHQAALIDLMRVQDRVAADVVQAHAQAQASAERLIDAEAALKDSVESVDKNFEGLGTTKRLGGDVILLVIRPQEVIAAIQTLQQAYQDYYSAVNDYNRAQFRLYRALGHPAQLVAGDGCEPDAATPPRRGK